jgi:hypothetical protein
MDLERGKGEGNVGASSGSAKKEKEEDFEDVILFVEYKYCTVCHIE